MTYVTDSNPERDTPDATCSCCGTSSDPATDSTADALLLEERVLEARLPRDLQVALGRLLGEEPVPTLAEWAATVRRHTGGGGIDVDDLCHTTERTGHWGELDGERYDFLCFYDAVVLSALVDRPVDVRTESPRGAVIEARALGTDDLAVTPEEAVFSFGVEAAVEPPAGDDPSMADVYAACCPYVRAFPDAAAYERWAETVPATTVGMSLAGATDVAAALVE